MIRIATPEDFTTVWGKLSRQTRSELRNSDTAMADWQAEFSEMVDRGEAYCAEYEGRPVAIFGFNDFGDYYSMWTVATDQYFALGAFAVRRTRRFFAGLKLAKPIVVVTTSPFKEVERWLRVLGFDFESREGATRVFTRNPA